MAQEISSPPKKMRVTMTSVQAAVIQDLHERMQGGVVKDSPLRKPTEGRY